MRASSPSRSGHPETSAQEKKTEVHLNMAAHRNSGGGGKTPFGTKVIIALMIAVAIMVLAYAWGSH
jgi:hypothetical protein